MARKLVVVNDAVRLVELGNIFGPISTPTRIPLEMIRTMCVKNRDVWECDPNDPRNRDRRVKLTLSNYTVTNFGISEKKEEIPDANEDPVTPSPAPAEEKKGITDYSFIYGGVNTDAAGQFDPVHVPAEEKKDEIPGTPVEDAAMSTPEAPVSNSDNTPSQEEKPEETNASAPVEEKKEEVPVQKGFTQENNKNPQNHGEKKNKKGK